MSPAQQRQLEWVESRMAIGQPVIEYPCPNCDEPCFTLVGMLGSTADCPHCNGEHVRQVANDGEIIGAAI